MAFLDEDLRQYLSGHADDALSQRIEEALGHDDALSDRLMALDPLSAPIQAAFAPLTPPGRIRIDTSPTRSWGGLGALAASWVLFIVAGLGVWMVGHAGGEDWHHEVAAYQALYVPQTIATLEATPDALDQQFARASEALGKDLSRTALDGLADLDLKRAQILGYGAEPLIQIVFAGPKGAPIALCIMARDGGASGPDQEVLSGLAAVHWADEAWGYILIGGQDSTWLSAVGSDIRAALAS